MQVPRWSPSSRSAIALFAMALVVMSALFFAGGYLAGHADGRTGNGLLSRSGLVPPASTPGQLSAEDQEAFGTLWETWGEIQRSYYRRDSLDRQELVRGAAKGMVDALGDPYSAFLTPQRREISDAELHGSFDGIGVQVDLRDGKLTVVAPIEGSPGALAGLQPSDVITHVDSRDISRLTLSDAVARIRGPRGTDVTLRVLRPGQPEPLTFVVSRGEVKLESVRSRLLEESGIAYVRISTFAEPTASQVRQQLRGLLQSHPSGLVLDLRANPGGYLSSAVEVSSQFLRDAVVLYQQRGGPDGEPKEYRTSGTPQASDLPLVVLVDRGSASAAEIVAAALRENQRATLVGERTFGKGTVQELRNLSDQSQLRMTVAQWLTPSGRPIQGEGIQPDLEVRAQEGRDAPLDAAIGVLRSNQAVARG